MTKSELIDKLQKKHSSILSDYNRIYRNGRNTLASSECRSRMKDVLDVIKELKNLSGETVKLREVCHSKNCLNNKDGKCQLGDYDCTGRTRE